MAENKVACVVKAHSLLNQTGALWWRGFVGFGVAEFDSVLSLETVVDGVGTACEQRSRGATLFCHGLSLKHESSFHSYNY